ncbi:MAG: hypothetical protein OQL08_09045 [Gammaproteobacteria bacterium]|nr:hypothetical protein [Gammaproteobacteria bacterium]
MTPNTTLLPVYWEPVAGTGERIAVGAIIEREDGIVAKRIIRDDVLQCMYGKAAKGVVTMLETGFTTIIEMVKVIGISGDFPAILGLTLGKTRHTHATTLNDALRICAMMYSSLANISDFDDMDDADAPSQDESNQRFGTAVRELVVTKQPVLEKYFGRSVPLLQDGKKTKFGFCNERVIIHFGVLSPVRQSSSVKDARARLWELHRAREFVGLDSAALIFAIPRQDDPTLSPKLLGAAKDNIMEIELEANSYKMDFAPVNTVEQAAERVLEYVD